jgi:hypothetical protein
MNKVHFDKISILQSLPNNELHTGTKLKGDIEIFNIAYGRGLQIELFDTHNKDEFLNIINKLSKMANYDRLYPVLHIEAHGSSDLKGIVLQSKEFVSWTDLKPYLINLNTATRLNLLVVFSLWHGAHFVSQLTPVDRSPCWGIVGPTKALLGPELLGSFSAFYQEVFKSGSAEMAVKKLNESSLNYDINYSFTLATASFYSVYNHYLNTLCTDESYANRARIMRKKEKKEKRNLIKIHSIGELKRFLKSSQKDYFEKYKVKYFMIDLFPENKNRFIVTYEDVMDYGRKRLAGSMKL